VTQAIYFSVIETYEGETMKETRRTRGTLKLNDGELSALQLIAAHREVAQATALRCMILEEARRILQSG
jgi:hypothetical protein